MDDTKQNMDSIAVLLQSKWECYQASDNLVQAYAEGCIGYSRLIIIFRAKRIKAGNRAQRFTADHL